MPTLTHTHSTMVLWPHSHTLIALSPLTYTLIQHKQTHTYSWIPIIPHTLPMLTDTSLSHSHTYSWIPRNHTHTYEHTKEHSSVTHTHTHTVPTMIEWEGSRCSGASRRHGYLLLSHSAATLPQDYTLSDSPSAPMCQGHKASLNPPSWQKEASTEYF